VTTHARYKGYTIRSTPLHDPDSLQWTLSITIESERRDGKVTAREFSDGNKFREQAEADLHGIAFGQLIIDGRVPWCSVE
jgi:hypothetical protein